MPDAAGSVSARKELAHLAARRDALRQAATLGDTSLRPTLDAALAELDAAIDALAAAHDGTGGGPPDESALDALHAERRLLRALFHEAPVALILVERDGAVRRVNQAAGELLGTGSGYATGRPFTAFVNLPSRAAVDSLLAARHPDRETQAGAVRAADRGWDHRVRADRRAGPAAGRHRPARRRRP